MPPGRPKSVSKMLVHVRKRIPENAEVRVMNELIKEIGKGVQYYENKIITQARLLENEA